MVSSTACHCRGVSSPTSFRDWRNAERESTAMRHPGGPGGEGGSPSLILPRARGKSSSSEYWSGCCLVTVSLPPGPLRDQAPGRLTCTSAKHGHSAAGDSSHTG